MRKYLSILFAVALFASCAKDIAPEKEETPVFKAGFESGFETKTYLNESLLNRWNADDRVSIFVGNTYNQQYKFEGKTGANSGSFSQIGNPGFFSGSKLEANYSVYPYSGNTSISEDGVVSFEFPSEQSYEPNSFGIGANTMFAVTENTSDYFLLFKNACGYLKVSLYGDATIKSVSVRSNGGEVIAGEGAVTATNTEVPSVAMSASGGDMITIDCGEGVQLGTTSETATDFYFVIPPVKFSQGITITAVGLDDTVFAKSTKASFSILRNKIQNLPAVKYEGVPKGNITFADANFKAYCVEKFDTNGDGEISYAEAAVVNMIQCSWNGDISSMDGIQYFTALDTLICAFDGLVDLDVSNNTKLKMLQCQGNQLTKLDLSNNTALTSLCCRSNQLSTLNLNQNVNLVDLECYQNKLTDLNLSNNPMLEELDCHENQLASIDVGQCVALIELNCNSNKLTSLDVSNNGKLKTLYCNQNKLNSINVRYSTSLTSLNCRDNHLDCLDVSNNTELMYLYCGYNQLARLDVSNNAELMYLSCNYNRLTSIDVSGNVKLKYLHCSQNPNLTEIWLKEGQNIQGFYYDTSVAEVKYK
jgi:hypothetical protein